MRTRGEGRRKLSVIAAATALAVATAGLGTAAGKGVGGNLKITVAAQNVIEGVVNSRLRQCERGRQVVLLYASGGVGFGKVGTDRTDAAGEWRIDAQVFPGKYSVRVKGLVTDEFSCRPLRVTREFFP